MANDPAFLFYPGDYLRDTQCLSEAAQVAYDRIMCEHMRNICISQNRLDFFTKRLTDEEKIEINSVLAEVDGGFEIPWVADSVRKRKEYSESRRNNRSKKDKIISSTYDSHVLSHDEHMENENEIVIEDRNEFGKGNTISEKDKKDFSKKSKKLSESEIKLIRSTMKCKLHDFDGGWEEYHNAMTEDEEYCSHLGHTFTLRTRAFLWEKSSDELRDYSNKLWSMTCDGYARVVQTIAQEKFDWEKAEEERLENEENLRQEKYSTPS